MKPSQTTKDRVLCGMTKVDKGVHHRRFFGENWLNTVKYVSASLDTTSVLI